MTLPHPYALLFLSSLAFAQTAPAVKSCPAKADKIHSLTEQQLTAICEKAQAARAAAEGFPNSHFWLKQCRQNMLMATQAGRVAEVTQQRLGGFEDKVPESLSQTEAFQAAFRSHLRLHNFSNISMAAIYRSRLKVRKIAADGKTALEWVKRDLDSSQRRLEQERRMWTGDQSLNMSITRGERNVKALTGYFESLEISHACLEQMKEPLDARFADWEKIKRALLANSFEKLVPATTPQEDEFGVDNRLWAKTIQEEQQYVLDMMANLKERDLAYRLAEGCQQNGCRGWASLLSFAGMVARTPVVSIIVKPVTAGLSADLAMRQGLTVWQQIREGANALVPFGQTLFDTEILDIEKGKLNAFKP